MDPLLLTAAAAAAQAAQGLGHAGLNTAQLAELAALSVHSSSQMMGPSAATMQQQPLQHAADTIRAAWGGSQTGMHPSSAEYAALLNELQAVSFGPAVRGAGQPTDTATAARGYGAVDPGPLPAQEANQQASMSVLSMLLLQQQQQQQQQQHGAHAVSTGVGASQPTPVQQPAAIGRAGKADGDGAVVQPPLVPFQHPLLAKVRAESKAISHSGTESPTIAASWSDAGGVGSGALSSASSPTAAALSHQVNPAWPNAMRTCRSR